MINYQKNQLSNGLTLITAPMKETKAVTVLIMVKVGSRYESEKESGISHFLEHMFFKGTQKRPTGLDISKELDSIGAEFNAFTSEEYTGFYVSSSSDHVEICLDILSDMLLNSSFKEDEIKKEKGVILEEINMYRDLPQKHVIDLAKEQFYPASALGRSVLGRSDNIKRFSQKDFLYYLKKHYNSQNTLIVMAGNQGKFDWVSLTQRYFSKIPSGQKNRFEKIKELQKKPVIRLHYKKTDQAHLVLGFRTFDRFHPDHYTLQVLNNLFGGIMSSRLFTEIREKRGLAYYIGSTFWEFDDAGVLLVRSGLDKKRIEEAIEVIINEFNKIKNIIVDEDEINKSKENIKGKFYLGLEDSFSIAEYLAQEQLLFDEIKDPEYHIDKIFKVKSEEIKVLAKEYFSRKNLNLTIIGPYKDEGRFEKLLKI